MPGFDQTGPMGRGSMTGWRMGKCNRFGQKQKEQPSSASTDIAENDDIGFRGRGLRFGQKGRGRGMGRQHRFRGGAE